MPCYNIHYRNNYILWYGTRIAGNIIVWIIAFHELENEKTYIYPDIIGNFPWVSQDIERSILVIIRYSIVNCDCNILSNIQKAVNKVHYFKLLY